MSNDVLSFVTDLLSNINTLLGMGAFKYIFGLVIAAFIFNMMLSIIKNH